MLVVDDEPRILKFLKSKLKASGYEVLTAGGGLEALEKVRMEPPDLLVLDVLMPGMNGFETLKQVRALSSVPVIILSARETNIDKIKGLELGADDYLSKPFNPDELVAWIEAVRRRLPPGEEGKAVPFITLGNMTIDSKKRLVILAGKEIPLTRIEWLLLSELTHHAGQLVTYDQLLTRVWGPEYRGDVQILRTWVSRLRHKMEKDPDRSVTIRTLPKTGYIIDLKPS